MRRKAGKAAFPEPTCKYTLFGKNWKIFHVKKTQTRKKRLCCFHPARSAGNEKDFRKHAFHITGGDVLRHKKYRKTHRSVTKFHLRPARFRNFAPDKDRRGRTRYAGTAALRLP